MRAFGRGHAHFHTFLSREEIAALKAYVPGAISGIPTLVVAYEEGDIPLGFMGIDVTKLEMLFLDPARVGTGIGKALIACGIAEHGVRTVTVNEQNPAALGFYEHMGFTVTGRSDMDERGNPYPILTLTLI